MGNELMNVPNFGLEAVRVYEYPQKILVDFAKKQKVSYYFLECIFKKFHRDIPVKYSLGAKILADIKVLADCDEFKRFIKKTYDFVEFKWKNRVIYVIPFDCYEVSKGVITYMEFKGYTKRTNMINGRFLEVPVDCDDVIIHIKYMLSQSVADSADFDVYIDSWAKRLIWECDNHSDEIISGKKVGENGQDSDRKDSE